MTRCFLFALAFALLPLTAGAEEIGAVGQIVPGGGIIDLGGTSGSVITSVRVKPGDAVKAGQLLMTIDDPGLKSGHGQAAKQLERARASAAEQVSAQRLAVQLAQQQLAQAKREYEAYQALGAHSTSLKEMGRMKDVYGQAQLSLKIEQSRLKVAEGDAANAVAEAERQAKIASSGEELRAPIAGVVLSVDRRVGARLSGSPAIRMGDLSSMYVVCQVYEGDLLKLAPNMRATIKSASLPRNLTGTVESVGRLIESRSKLGEVRIRLDQREPANRLVGMEVEVTIAR